MPRTVLIFYMSYLILLTTFHGRYSYSINSFESQKSEFESQLNHPLTWGIGLISCSSSTMVMLGFSFYSLLEDEETKEQKSVVYLPT